MSGIIKSVLALIGLLAVLSHPVTRQGLDALSKLWSKAAVYRVAQFSVTAAAPAAGSVAAAPLAAELKAAEASLPPVEPAEGAGQAEPGDAGEGTADDVAMAAPEEDPAETDKALLIYKEAEKDEEE